MVRAGEASLCRASGSGDDAASSMRGARRLGAGSAIVVAECDLVPQGLEMLGCAT